MHVFQIAKAYKAEIENDTGLFYHQVPLVCNFSQRDDNPWQNMIKLPISLIIFFLILISLV